MSYESSVLAVPVSGKDHAQGYDGAVATLVEYGDFQCPACAAAHPMVQQIQRHYAGNLNFVFRNFPLKQIHPLAELAAELAEGADSIGEYWKMHDWLFENQQRWSAFGAAGLQEGMRELGIDEASIEKALSKPDIVDRIQKDYASGVQSGVSGTPNFFINGRLYSPERHGSLARAIGHVIAKQPH